MTDELIVRREGAAGSASPKPSNSLLDTKHLPPGRAGHFGCMRYESDRRDGRAGPSVTRTA